MLDNQKDQIKKMKKYSGFLASLKHGSESSGGSFIGGILLLTGCVHGYYNFMRRLFSISDVNLILRSKEIYA